ncbi:MAG: LemA family protein [Coriobacteriaceae bacterium]
MDTQLQIPNLVETVKGYAKHESETLEAVMAARVTAMSTTTTSERFAANNWLTAVLRQLFAVSEAYPDLKANANFQQLQAELTDAENRVSYARQSYNDCVLSYNSAAQTFPSNTVAGSSFQKREGFKVGDAAARQTPSIKF